MNIPDLLGMELDKALEILSQYEDLKVIQRETKSPKQKSHYEAFAKRVIKQDIKDNTITLITAEL